MISPSTMKGLAAEVSTLAHFTGYDKALEMVINKHNGVEIEGMKVCPENEEFIEEAMAQATKMKDD